MAGKILVPELLEFFPYDALLGDQDLRLVEGDGQGLGVVNFGAQQPHVGRKVLQAAPKGYDVAHLHHQVRACPERLPAPHDVEDAVLRVSLAELGDRLAGGLFVLQTVGAEPGWPVTAQPDIVKVRYPEFLFVLLRGFLSINAPPLRQVLDRSK